MADNYLERKMEEHRSRQGMKATAAPRRASAFTFPPRRVVVVMPGHELEHPVVESLRLAGHKVAVVNPQATSLAQATGARCYPFTPDVWPT